MATSVRPLRHGRPNVSLTITPTLMPNLARTISRMRRAERSLSIGNSAAYPRSTLDKSMPLLAQTKPCLVSVIIKSPRRRTMRVASCSTSTLCESGSFGSIWTRRPSALDTIFCVTTKTSLSRSGPFGSALHASEIMSPSCCPGTISPIPLTPHAVIFISVPFGL